MDADDALVGLDRSRVPSGRELDTDHTHARQRERGLQHESARARAEVVEHVAARRLQQAEDSRRASHR